MYGTTLNVTPPSPVTTKTSITLVAHVYPTPGTATPMSSVTFTNGTVVLATVPVVTTGPTAGTATAVLSTLAPGMYAFGATWSGTAAITVPTNASTPITYVVYSSPVVTSQPEKSQSVVAGGTATFTAAATGTPTPSVQWQALAPGSATWANIPGATGDSYTTGTLTLADSGTQFRAVFTNPAGSVDSGAAAVTVTAPSSTTKGGYWEVASDGGLFTFGDGPLLRLDGRQAPQPARGRAWPPPPTAAATGRWPPTAASSPSATPSSTARWAASPSTSRSSAWPPPPTGGGYWEVASDGGLFAFGDAQFYGSMGGKPLNQPIVGMAATPDGEGYWEVAADGGLFAFGDAAFYGSMGGKPLNQPIVGMAATPDGGGYWEVASDGGLFAFGDAQLLRLDGRQAPQPADRRHGRHPRQATATGRWPRTAASSPSATPFFGSMGGTPLNQPVVGMSGGARGATSGRIDFIGVRL